MYGELPLNYACQKITNTSLSLELHFVLTKEVEQQQWLAESVGVPLTFSGTTHQAQAD